MDYNQCYIFNCSENSEKGVGIVKVKLLRISKHITQKELAKMVGISHVTLARVEKDDIDQIRVGTLKKIAKVLGTTVHELFFSEEEKQLDIAENIRLRECYVVTVKGGQIVQRIKESRRGIHQNNIKNT